MNRENGQQPINTFGINDLPVCAICHQTQQKTKCDISKSQREKCGLAICRKCQQSNPEWQCDELLTGCKKKMKQHRFKNLAKEKIKNSISYRFQKQSKLRSKLKVEGKYSQIDEDMTHILAALLGQSVNVYNSTYRKQLEKLVEDLKKMKNTIESQIERGNLPVYKGQVYSENPQEDNGVIACGYLMNDFSKGKNQIIRSFY